MDTESFCFAAQTETDENKSSIFNVSTLAIEHNICLPLVKFCKAY